METLISTLLLYLKTIHANSGIKLTVAFFDTGAGYLSASYKDDNLPAFAFISPEHLLIHLFLCIHDSETLKKFSTHARS